MARFTNGWIKIHRKCLDGDIGQNGVCLALWVKLLGWANLRETKIARNGVQVSIPRGSLVTSTRQIAEDLNFSQSTIRRWLRYLHQSDRIRLTRGSRGTVITILNYNQYQDNDAAGDKPMAHQRLAKDSLATRQEFGIEEEKKKRIQEEEVCTERSADALCLGTLPLLPEQSDPVFEDLTVTEFLARAGVGLSTQALWVKTYDGNKEWLKREILKAIAWLDANKAKAPKKNFKKFLGSWFSRGWDDYRKTLPSEKAKGSMDWDYVFGKEGK